MSEYAGYIANLKDKVAVVATEDILSDKGILLAKSGTKFNNKTYDNILKFKLLKPIEDSITLSNQLNSKLIYDRITQLVSTDFWLQTLNNKLGDKTILQRCCLQMDNYPLLLQKLTVLSMEIPNVFNQSILSAYLAYICGLINQEEQQTIKHYFLAGLSHDIGFLHIDHYILTKEEQLTAQEWRKIQSHPIIGYEILKRIQNFPPSVIRAVLEHHENLDGTGYPRAKTARDLGSLGQLISLLDNVIAIYNRKFKPLNRSLRSIAPIIQINMHSYFPDAVSLILRALKHAPESPIKEAEASVVEELIDHVHKEQAYIEQAVNTIKQGNENIGFSHNNNEVFALQSLANNIIRITRSAGLTDSSYSASLKQATQEDKKALYNEVEDTRRMLDEVVYQLQTYVRNASVFINKNPDHPISSAINHIIDQFSHLKRPSPPSALNQHWQQLAKASLPDPLDPSGTHNDK